MGAAAPAALALGGSAFSAYEQGQAGKATAGYYDYLSKTAKINESLAGSENTAKQYEIGAQENQEQIGLTNRINATIGAQKASVVSGVGGSSRSAQDIIGDTLNKGNLDEAALRLNADMKSRNADISARMGAFNYRTQAAGFGVAGANAITASKYGQVSSLLGGAGSVANSWYLGSLYAGRGYGQNQLGPTKDNTDSTPK